MKINRATTIIAGLIAGIIMLNKIRKYPAPSIVAAWSSSRGIDIMNWRIKKILNAPPPQKYGNINGR
ncbi:hypothetical protein D3C84_1064850 [compost metagenome]